MKACISNPRKVNVVTLGCAKNLFDSEQIMTHLKANEFDVEHEAKLDDFGIVVINTSGFPGETEEDYQDLLCWFGEMNFERLGCFTYCHEENTHAYLMEDDVPKDVKNRRVEEVMELQAGISEEINLRHTGKEFKMMIDRCEGGYWIGRTEFDSPDVNNEVRIKVCDNLHLRIGDFTTVLITGAKSFDLDAEVVEENG